MKLNRKTNDEIQMEQKYIDETYELCAVVICQTFK